MTAAPRAFRSATALVLLVGVVASATVSLVLGPAAAAQSAQSAVTKRAEPAARGVGPAVSTVPINQSDTRVAVGAEPDGTAVTLDVTVLAPSDGQRHPAVLLAHGFGGSKDDLIERGRLLATRGYVVAAYTARGFGQSGGRVHLSDPAFEVKDAQLLIDALAARPDVQLDRPGDPRVGVAGASYGGALALMLAGVDRRIDTVAAAITWNDLANALFPQALPPHGGMTSPAALGTEPPAGVAQRRWVSTFFSTALTRAPGTPASSAPAANSPTANSPTVGSPARRAVAGSAPTQVADPLTCGRFDPQVCALILEASTTGRPTPALTSLLRAHSPAPTLSQVTAPTLLMQGLRDSLFGLAEADATARALAQAGTPVAVRWFDGGHDGGSVPADEDTLIPWLDRQLRGSSTSARPGFSTVIPATRRGDADRTLSSPAYPGSGGIVVSERTTALAPAEAGSTGWLLSPPGGEPAALTVLPGGGVSEALASVGAGVGYRLAALPGQSLAFDTPPAEQAGISVGSPRLTLNLTSTARDATLFLSLWRLSASGPTSARPLVAPIRVATTPGQPVRVEVALPAGVYDQEKSSRWRVLISSTQSGFAVPTDARRYRVELADAVLRWPTVPQATTSTPADEVDREVVVSAAVLVGLVALVLGLAGWTAWRRSRGDRRGTRADLAEVPLAVEGLVKTYRDGHRAVDEVSWRAERGQVVGLLGPNGAGKTTTLRMVMGLIRPDQGAIHVLGEPVHADSPVLARVGALIEGPGFLPHLTGRENLRAYWQATGRPLDEAHLEEALDVAALSDALERPVRSYSHGMRQRLGIAQAMLGRPEVLILDEPTNGLDPPQIAAMRPILRDYAATGRTVVVSSHLLAEVEATCTHVVVMHRGQVILAGPVAELLDSSHETLIGLAVDCDAAAVAERLRVSAAHDEVQVETDGGQACLAITSPATRDQIIRDVLAAGGQIEWVRGRRHLEDVFLGVIAASDAGRDGSPRSLREVRPR